MPLFQTEPNRLGEVLKNELPGLQSRDEITLIAGSGAAKTIKVGQVLGKVPTGSAVAAAKSGGNTGNGAFTVDATTPVLPGAKPGIYRVTCIAAAANGGTFRVEDPDGNVLGDVAVGATFSDDIRFVIADGAADFIVGDAFDVTVSVTAVKYDALNFAATNGLQIAAGVSYDNYTVPDGADLKATAIVRGPAEIVERGLVWPAGATSAQKNQALAQLADLGFIVRKSA